MAVVICPPCKQEGTIQHPQPEAKALAQVHDGMKHRGVRTATTR